MQDESCELMKKLCDEGFSVMLETAGNMPIKEVDKRVKIIMDLKCPSSKAPVSLNILMTSSGFKFMGCFLRFS